MKRGEVVDRETGEIVRSTGAGMFSACPRSGSILLEDFASRRILMNTQCKTWSCKSCRDRMLSLFRQRIVLGVSTTGRCAFMTITYKEGSPRLEDAGCVAKDWRALWRLLKKKPTENLQWMRVMELTKKGTPHHHLVIGPVKGRVKCWSGKRLQIKAYQDGLERGCECLAHRWATLWRQVTGDSWIVHATEVAGAEGAGAYMAKYLQKEFDGERAKALGMARRWSSSRGWPGNGRRRLRQTERGGWSRAVWAAHHVGEDILGGPEDLLVRTGNDLSFKRDVEKGRKALERQVSQFVEDDSAAVLGHRG